MKFNLVILAMLIFIGILPSALADVVLLQEGVTCPYSDTSKCALLDGQLVILREDNDNCGTCINGINGLNGSQGPQGNQGIQGIPGLNGTNISYYLNYTYFITDVYNVTNSYFLSPTINASNITNPYWVNKTGDTMTGRLILDGSTISGNPLYIKGTTTGGIYINASQDAGISMKGAGSPIWKLYVADSQPKTPFSISQLGFNSPFRIEPYAPSSLLYLNSSGRVGIMTATPTATLDINGSLNVAASAVALSFNGSMNASYIQNPPWITSGQANTDNQTQAAQIALKQDIVSTASWVPTFTGLQLGGGVVIANYTKVGDLVSGSIHVTFGSSTNVTGGLFFSTPTNIRVPGTLQPLGVAFFGNTGTAQYGGVCYYNTASTIGLRSFSVSGTDIIQSAISATSPFTWGTSDRFGCTFTYQST